MVKHAVRIQPARGGGEDRLEVVAVNDTTVIIVADGAGGMGGGAEAADEAVKYLAEQAQQAAQIEAATLASWIEAVDHGLSRNPAGGLCTALVVIVSPNDLLGGTLWQKSKKNLQEDSRYLSSVNRCC